MNKKALIIIGIILLILGLSLINEGENVSHYTFGDPTIKARAKAPYEKWGTILTVVGGVSLLGGVIYKKNNNLKNKIDSNVDISKVSTTTQLEDLKCLLDKGIITQEEFESKKKELLSKI